MSDLLTRYMDFVQKKVISQKDEGFAVDASEINPLLKPHARDIAQWMIRGGKRACFASFGLHKTAIQLEVCRIVSQLAGGLSLIVLPLGVRNEFLKDAQMLTDGNRPDITDEQREQLNHWQADHPERIPRVKFIKRAEEIDIGHTIYLTNYETVRDGKLDPKLFICSSLDEAAVLRSFGGTKTFREFMALFAGDDRRDMNNPLRSGEVPYRFVATATPDPNEFIEILAYAAYLGIGDVSGLKTRFFKRDSTKADRLTIHPGREQEFWLWVSSWAVFVQKPSDLGYSDEGYELPDLDIRWHEVQIAGGIDAGQEQDGQRRLLRKASGSVTDAAREKRVSIDARIRKMLELRSEDPAAHRILWHDLEDERRAIERAAPEAVSVFGAQDIDEREEKVTAFADGSVPEIAAKPIQFGSGVNWQRHCAWAIYLGINCKFNDFIQSLHRLHRFLQPRRVRVDLIYTDAEIGSRQTLERKWAQYKETVKRMTDLIREYGLSHAAMMSKLNRAMGVERIEMVGKNHKVVLNDSVIETANMPENSVGLIVTSIPFSTQYEYSPNYCDFGHTASNAHFFEQMDFLTPSLLRVLQPGRLAVIHVKDRIVHSGLTGLGFQTLYRFSDKVCDHFEKHGFAFMGRKTIVTDVVRENNQTYRLGWSEQCKDGTKMGVGSPEYLLLFRKPPTDRTNSYADNPVVKSKRHYTLGRWQVDAHGFTRSSGNRFLSPEELRSLSHREIFGLFRDFSLNTVYDFEHHVKIGDLLNEMERLPVTFMLLQPQSWHPDVWTDVARMLTLNSSQSSKNKAMHLCPLQFDIVDRAIEQWSNPGEIIYDPFAGIGTVPYRAVLLGRFGLGCELSAPYFFDGAGYCRAAEDKLAMPDLFSVLEKDEVNCMSDRVNRLVCTSVEDCKTSLPFESSRKVLNEALRLARQRKKKTMARNIKARIRQLDRAGGKGRA